LPTPTNACATAFERATRDLERKLKMDDASRTAAPVVAAKLVESAIRDLDPSLQYAGTPIPTLMDWNDANSRTRNQVIEAVGRARLLAETHDVRETALAST
jgi:hypothetical protein